MSKVFEALQRQQQNQENQEAGRDPLAATTGSPDAPAGQPQDQQESGSATDDLNSGYELPSLIGAPTGPRSNDGMIFSAGLAEASPYRKAGETPGPLSNSRRQGADLPTEISSQSEQEHRARTDSSSNYSSGHPAHRSVAESVAAASALRRAKIERAEAQKIESPEEPAPIVSTPREIPVEHLSVTQLHPRLIMLTEPQAVECEQYRTLRTQLFHAAEKKQIQVVTITSAMPGEGKTSTVLNLALAIAQSKEKRVLIIDGDLRRPNIASYLGLQPKVGLAEVLSGESEPLNTIFCIDGQELYILPVYGESEKPTELLSSERLAEMIKLLRGYFDFILIDSPPVMPFADSRLLANHADAVIMVIRAGVVPYETVEKAIEVLPASRMLGVVLNSAEHLKENGYYDYYYNYSNPDGRRQSFWERIAQRFRRSRV